MQHKHVSYWYQYQTEHAVWQGRGFGRLYRAWKFSRIVIIQCLFIQLVEYVIYFVVSDASLSREDLVSSC